MELGHDILEYINWKYRDKPGQKKVVESLIQYGLSVDVDGIFLGGIKIPYSSIAEALDVDRRVVVSTVKSILEDSVLRPFFKRLLPAGPFLKDVARLMGYTVLTIIPERDQPGILAGVTGILAKHGVNIIQVIAEAPHLKTVQKLYIIIEGEPPGDVFNEIRELEYIDSIEIS